MAVERLDEEKRAFTIAFAQSWNVSGAAHVARVDKKQAEAWLQEPEVQTAVRLISDKAAQAEGVSYQYLISKQTEILERCMEARPVVNKQGKVVEGKFTFDAFNANKAIENLAKLTGHLGQGQTNITVNVAQMSVDQRRNEVDRLLQALEARANARQELPAPAIDAEFVEASTYDDPLFE